MEDELRALIVQLRKEAEELRAECERSRQFIRESQELLDAIAKRLRE